MTKLQNQAFIDGQNLYLGTTQGDDPWQVDLVRFRKYLKQKYHIEKAYYFLGCKDAIYSHIYKNIQNSGFILIFREHPQVLRSHKKGNVDTDIVFMMMKNFHENPSIKEFFLVSGDGDYYKTVKYLYEQGKLGKILFPAKRKASSLYRRLGNANYDYLDNLGVKNKIRL